MRVPSMARQGKKEKTPLAFRRICETNTHPGSHHPQAILINAQKRAATNDEIILSGKHQ